MSNLTLTDQQRQGIADLMVVKFTRSGFDSQARFARSIGLTPTDYTNISKGAWKAKPRLVGDGKWMRVGREVGYSFSASRKWQVVETSLYKVVVEQLDICQRESTSMMFCDLAGFGKTTACKHYAANHKHVYYLDCSATPGKLPFARALATAVGVNIENRNTNEILADLIYYLKAIPDPLIIIDEAGDADVRTYLLIKRLWNELEGICGFYMIGARGLRRRIDRGSALKMVGFEELFSRFGCKATDVVPAPPVARLVFLQEEARLVARANGISDPATLNRIVSELKDTDDLRGVYRQVRKALRHAA